MMNISLLLSFLSMTEKTAHMSLNQLESTLNEYFAKKAPPLPSKAKETLVQLAPWLVIIGIVLSVPAVLALFGFGAFMSAVPFGAMAMAGAAPMYLLSIAFLVASMALQGMAIQGLFARSYKAWRLLFIAALVNGVYQLLTGNISGLIIGWLIGFYILFQVKEYYK